MCFNNCYKVVFRRKWRCHKRRQERRTTIIVIITAESWRLFARAFLNFTHKRIFQHILYWKVKYKHKVETKETHKKNLSLTFTFLNTYSLGYLLIAANFYEENSQIYVFFKVIKERCLYNKYLIVKERECQIFANNINKY